jgi:hypothetical protein
MRNAHIAVKCIDQIPIPSTTPPLISHTCRLTMP